jgi:hypothetical protein
MGDRCLQNTRFDVLVSMDLCTEKRGLCMFVWILKERKEGRHTRERKTEKTLLDGCWTDDLCFCAYAMHVCICMYVCTYNLSSWRTTTYEWWWRATTFLSFFPFVRPLVTDSNLSFDANNICPICSYLRRKKRRRISEWRKGQREGYEKKMDIVHIYVYIYLGTLFIQREMDERKRKWKMSLMRTRMEQNTVAKTFISLFIHSISQKCIVFKQLCCFFFLLSYITTRGQS